ncbi:MAG: ribokinase, partial [Paludisphaera borealis]|uniref:ribokinase n=1 Tax=Paludisphaera borealis TaxID=1387353 RepID=UPI00284AE24C
MARVVVIGSSNTDMTVRLPRLPEAGETVLGGAFTTTPGGKGANQAVAARRAGAEVVFVAAVGDDELGRQALALFRREGLDVSHVRVVDQTASGVALIFVGDDGENMIGVASGANARIEPEDVDRLPASLFRRGDVLLTGLEIPHRAAVAAMRRGREAGMTVILNPAPAPAAASPDVAELLAAADVVTPNRLEASALAGIPPRPETDWADCARRLMAKGPRAVVITLGAEGCLTAEGDRFDRIAARRVVAVDTVGAGDAFNGAL